MPNFSDRQQQLYELLQARQRISTEEIKKQFSISSATASRDIHALVAAGMATKASHGVRLAPPQETTFLETKCHYCGGTAKERTAFIIQMQDGTQRSACCCHCGLMALEQAGAQTALARDYLYGRMVNARQATYILGSRVSLCCEPSVLCFANREEAACFQLGFGGSLHPMDAAISILKSLMSL
jgi:DeoR family transcriptional regulator, copper-sensing transcriptional repressor